MIKAIISDFDGTLVDTFQANLFAYQKAFREVGLSISEENYRACFGLRFDDFMAKVGIQDAALCTAIKESKRKLYPSFFERLVLNRALIGLIVSFKQLGGKTAIASTAAKENLLNAVNYLGIADAFTSICAGMDVKHGKPSPEIYMKTMDILNVEPQETLIFEDSDIGIQAAKASGASVMKITADAFSE